MKKALLAAIVSTVVLLVMIPGSSVWADDGDHHQDGDSHDSAAEQIGNSLCPVTTDESIDPSIFVDYQGRRVYFCCERCRKQFIDSPETYLPNLPQVVEAEEAHSHERDHGSAEESSFGNRALRFAGAFHPLAVHFPIALLISALIAEILASLSGVRRFLEAARVFILFGAPMAVISAILGWSAGRNATYPDGLMQVLTTHRWLGTTTAALALFTLFALERYWRQPDTRLRIVYLSALGLTVLFVGITGHLGGSLIFGTEHFTW